MAVPVLIDVDSRGRASLERLHVAPGRYLGEVEPDGTVVLHPAPVITSAQGKLLANSELLANIDDFAAHPDSGVLSGRPRRR